MYDDIVVAVALSIGDRGVCGHLFRLAGLGSPAVERGELFREIPVGAGGKLYFERYGNGRSGGR